MAFKLFIDSDVIIDFFTDRKPYSEAAHKLFLLNKKKKATLYISAVSVNNIYYIVRRVLGHKKTIETLKILLETTKIVKTGKDEIQEALMSNFSDFEDSVQHATASTIKGVDVIITRNVKDYKYSKIAVMTPMQFLKIV